MGNPRIPHVPPLPRMAVFYSGDTRVDSDDSTLTGRDVRVLAFVRQHPGVTGRQIEERFSVRPQNLGALCERGVLRREFEGRAYRYWVSEAR